MTSRPKKVPAPRVELEPNGVPAKTRDGSTWQGFRPVAKHDNRYFERATRPDGRVEWFILM
jgi:hypothetical protein